ncbi:hypothetical protein EPUL_001941 [Erysiphe pulchra]|uniref:Glycosyltransferase family 34 protein n=1 Tax=Erysiphe pulchra TaxID=225359 RepID=A0A2S4PZT6_9PEZI|nr:hypothetical protein EPUL_001941 [Erysiphe pulchra]
MSSSRSPSPRTGNGWASPGINIDFSDSTGTARSSPLDHYHTFIGNERTVTWESSKTMKNKSSRFPPYDKKNYGFFTRLYNHLSRTLLRFNMKPQISYAEKEKLGRGRWSTRDRFKVAQLSSFVRRTRRKTKIRLLTMIGLIAVYILFYFTPAHYWWRRTKFLGGGQKFVLILAANQGGGVMEWKGPREWAIERDSVRNKKRYVKRWGYDLDIVDMTTKKRYAHEWREGWEKVDTIRKSMQKYPKAEWFWWLDLNTVIMEPSYSLQSHIFNHLATVTYRDINKYNPLNITHPFPAKYLDAEDLSLVGDGKPSSINLIVPQDCSGFNLGSFFIKRSSWSDRLLDVWWDPVGYEQKHMEWEHKEQDVLEHLYQYQPWVRSHTAFIPQRMINSFPTGACSQKGNNSKIHYDQKDRDFVVNMAGCEWGRDCWGEMYNFREISNYLNRTLWERFKEDIVALIWEKLTGRKIRI